MRKTPIWAAFDDGATRVEMNVSKSDIDSPYSINDHSIKGFWSTPSIKTSLTESQIRNGSHGIDHKVLYSSRVVTIPFVIRCDNRDELIGAKNDLSMLIGSPTVRFELHDGLSEATYVEGMIAIEYSLDIDEKTTSGEITLTCIDAERRSVEEHLQMLGFALSSNGNGMTFGEKRTGLVFPLNFGVKTKTGVRNSAVIHNRGSYEADVVIEAIGAINGLIIQWESTDGNNGTLEYSGFIAGSQTVLFDSKTESATIDGSDFSDLLIYRQFPRVPANGDTRILALPLVTNSEQGIVNVKHRDTWM